jgi:D-alanyl-D-alanine carboxypeptidase/D-alanyl-D-alanine endopeptidase (penicillin-binding protein 7)
MRRESSILLAGLALLGPAGAAVPAFELASAHVLVIDDATGQVLLAKEPKQPAPIASLTKLLTAMVVLDARQSPKDVLRITDADVDRLKRTRSGVPVGTALPRATLIELALVASDNRAASALARHYRSGIDAFNKAMQRKIRMLGLEATTIEEPTGLSPANAASAEDMARVLKAAARYPDIARWSSQPVTATTVAGKPWEARNTNAWVGMPGWDVMLSKTGYIREAGLCLGMRLRVGERLLNMVLMGAPTAAERALDVQNIAFWLGGVPPAVRTAPSVEPGSTATPTGVSPVHTPEPPDAGGDAPAAAEPAEPQANPVPVAPSDTAATPGEPLPITVIRDDESRR